MLDLFFIESKRQWIVFRRYPVEAFAGVIVFTIIFFGMFTGSKYLAGGNASFGSKLDVVVCVFHAAASFVAVMPIVGAFWLLPTATSRVPLVHTPRSVSPVSGVLGAGCQFAPLYCWIVPAAPAATSLVALVPQIALSVRVVSDVIAVQPALS